MDSKIKAKWVKALRSGKYKQGTGSLYLGRRYCCLGVLCRVAGAKLKDGAFVWEGTSNYYMLPEALRRKVRIHPGTQKKLVTMNDGKGYLAPSNFKQIAAYINKNL